MMKIILKQDVEGLGKTNDIAKVKDGYARNFLIPKGLAVRANSSNLKSRENDLKIQSQKDHREEIKARKTAERLASLNLVFKAKAGAEGKIFGTITTTEIAEKATEKLGINIDRRRIHLMEPIRRLGAYNIPIRLHSNVEASILIQVEADGELLKEASPAEAPAASEEVVTAPAAVDEATDEQPAEAAPAEEIETTTDAADAESETGSSEEETKE